MPLELVPRQGVAAIAAVHKMQVLVGVGFHQTRNQRVIQQVQTVQQRTLGLLRIQPDLQFLVLIFGQIAAPPVVMRRARRSEQAQCDCRAQQNWPHPHQTQTATANCGPC